MKKFINLLLIFAVFFVNFSCASSNSAEKNQTTETLKPETEVSNHPFKIANGEYSTIMDSSIVSKGNNARLKTVLEKAKNGEKLYIAAIGGSVTEGAGPANFKDGYAYQFVKKFKEKCSMPPLAYLNNLRMYKAMSLLAGTEESVEKIAKAVGVADASYFARMFKKHTGISPTEYKNIFK